MANDTSTSLAAAFKYVQRDKMCDDVPKVAGPLATAIRKSAKRVFAGGKNLDTTWSWKKYRGVGVKVLSDGGDFATPAASGFTNPTLALCHYSFAVGVTGHAQAMGSGPEASFMKRKILAEKTEEIRDGSAFQMNQFLMNDGTQTTLALVTSVSGNILTLESTSLFLFVEGETYGCYDATADSDTTDKFTNGFCTKVDYQNSAITVTDAGTAAAGDYIAVKGVRGTTPPNGIRNLLGKTTGTVQNINRATAGNHFAIPNVISTSGALTSAKVDQIRDLVQTVGGARSTGFSSKWVFTPTTRAWAAIACIGQNRFADMGNFKLGTATMKVADADGEKEFMEEPMLRDGEIWCIDPSKLVIAYPQGMEGGEFVQNPAGDIFWQQTAASGAGYADAVLMYYVQRWNLGCDDFRAQGYMSGFVSP